MPRITWDDPGSRLYHAGIDRGMLYVGEVFAAWNGLISVAESSTGGESKPFYLDGNKVLNVPGSDSFNATIDTYAAPEEFAGCAGRLTMGAGLYAADQPRQRFGFSYRNLIGSDTDGNRFAYKLHIIYNALASFTDFAHGTINESPSPTVLSWSMSTVPIQVAGFRPTAHFVADSRRVSTENLASLEDILYGTAESDPRMPTSTELLSLLAS